MTTIDDNLKWRRQADRFNPSEKRVLLGLSHKKKKWRTLDGLQTVTQLEYDDLTSALADLLRDGLVTGSYIRETYEPLFGLAERVLGASEQKWPPSASPLRRTGAVPLRPRGRRDR